jgi:hypothetical protein
MQVHSQTLQNALRTQAASRMIESFSQYYTDNVLKTIIKSLVLVLLLLD